MIKKKLFTNYLYTSDLILDDSIRNNITFGDLKFDENRFNESINITELNVWIHNLQNKDKTIVENLVAIYLVDRNKISLEENLFK